DWTKKCEALTNESYELINGDTYLCKDTFLSASVSAGLVMEATRKVIRKHSKKEKKKYALTLNRPPGHHCDGHNSHGYCYINNVAVSIDQVRHSINSKIKILVLDVDIHHGDGTQKLFYCDPFVLTVSFHQYDGVFYPCTGKRKEYGPSHLHEAFGTNINIPLYHDFTDYDMLYALRNVVWPIVEQFQPELAFYAVGTDGVEGDLAGPDTRLTPLVFGQICFELKQRCNKIVVVTEGGYTTSYLAEGFDSVLRALSGVGYNNVYSSSFTRLWVRPEMRKAVDFTRRDLKSKWNFPELIFDDSIYLLLCAFAFFIYMQKN
ncbi:putative catalytic subunit of a class II histone deacetylase complex, partial [Reticulomyxa filosa]